MKKNKNFRRTKNKKGDNSRKLLERQVRMLKSIVENFINKQASPIIDLLIGKKHVNEFLIAKKLKLTINQARNILYKLSDNGLVSFIRKKDKRKGWYIYFWTLNTYHSFSLLEQNLKKNLENLEFQLRNRKEKRYFFCNTCSIEVTEETALLNNFTCPECEQVYQLSENKESIEKLEREISKLRREIELVSIERKMEENKIEKKKEVRINEKKNKMKALKLKAKRKASRLKEQGIKPNLSNKIKKFFYLKRKLRKNKFKRRTKKRF